MAPLTDEAAEAELKAACDGPLASQLNLESEAQKKQRLANTDNGPATTQINTKDQSLQPKQETLKEEKKTKESKDGGLKVRS